MKNTKTILLLALIIMIILNVILLIYSSHLRNKIAMLSNIDEEVAILDGGDTAQNGDVKTKKQDRKKDKEPAADISTSLSEDNLPTVRTEDELLEDIIGRSISESMGAWDIWTESLSKQSYSHNTSGNNSGRMVSASIIKLFIMGATYQEIGNSNISHDSVYSDIHNMIAISDNDAANRLIRALGNGDSSAGLAVVNRFAEDIGCYDTQINRVMLAENGLENYTSSKDCATILRMIYNRNCVSQQWSDEMLTHLKAQTVNDRIPQGVPPNTEVAHKTGNLTNICNGDVGIVFSDTGDYIICAINNGTASEGTINDIIAEISASVYNYYKALN